MSFYVTIPSTSSPDIYPDNTSSSFSTRLQSTLNLEGSWQVALTDFSYRQSISSNIGNIFIVELKSRDINVKSDKNVDIKRFELIAYDGEPFSDLLKRINVHMNSGNYGEILIEDNKLKLNCSEKILIYFHGLIKELLNINHNKTFENGNFIGNSYRNDDLIIRNEFFFFYTNFIEDQYVGNIKTKLLDTVAIQGKKGEAMTITINNPHYVDINMSEISTIKIDIKDSVGEKIHFDNLSKVIVKLHFRPKRYE